MSPEGPPRTADRRPRLARDFVEAHRRRRYVDAAAEILHEFGRPGLTTTNVVHLAGGSRGTFYREFSGVEDCVGHGITLARTRLFGVLDQLPAEGEWRGQLGAAIAGFYEAVAAEPLLAELFLVHSACSRTQAGAAAFRLGGERFLPLLRRGRGEAEARGRRPPPAAVEECLSRAIVALAGRRVRCPAVQALPDESPPMTASVASYYLGP